MLPCMWRSARSVALVLSAMVLLTACSADQPAEPAAPQVPRLEASEEFTTSQVTLRGPEGETVEVPVYVAATQTQRAYGLMNREELPAEAGMVFLHPAEETGGYYMFQTLIPLSIAFFDQEGQLVGLLDMEPCTEDDPGACEIYDPGVSYTTTLEVNQGFFADNGVSEGWSIELPEDLPEPS
jgi:uncharacterized membrane protein (UPF0127 family)